MVRVGVRTEDKDSVRSNQPAWALPTLAFKTSIWIIEMGKALSSICPLFHGYWTSQLEGIKGVSDQ